MAEKTTTARAGARPQAPPEGANGGGAVAATTASPAVAAAAPAAATAAVAPAAQAAGAVGAEAVAQPAASPASPQAFYQEQTDLFRAAIEACQDDSIIGWAHDHMDPDTMGAAGLCYLILKRRFKKRFACYYSKRMTFLMNRNLARNFLPAQLLRRCEDQKNLKETALAAPLILILDATQPEIMTDLNRLIRRNGDFRQKAFFFVDHHRRGENDIEEMPNATGVRIEGGQSTAAIFVHFLRNLGLELNPKDEEEFKIAIAAKAGIDIDLIGLAPGEVTEATREALAYLDGVIGDEGRALLEKLRSLKNPLSWYTGLGSAYKLCEEFDPTIAVCGLGVIDDGGMVPFVANELMDTGQFKTAIVFAIVYDRLEDRIVAVDLEASGRSTQNTEIVLPDLFGEVFFLTDEEGRRIAKGGGRSSMLLGEHSSTGASVPLHYWLSLQAPSVEVKIETLRRFAWPVEFQRLRNLLASRLPVKTEKILSAAPLEEPR